MFLGLVVVGAIAAVAAYFLTRSSAPAKAAPGATTARTPVKPMRAGHAAREAANAEPEHLPVHEGTGPDLSDVSPSVKKWKEPGLPGTFREIVAPDDSVNEEELMTYRVRRLRFQLTDAAAACYDGPDSKEQIALAYTLVVERGTLFVENVRELSSNLHDGNLKDCIVNAVRTLRAPSPDVPDMKKEQETVIQLHDLNARNRSIE